MKTIEELKKLNTKNLLAYYKAERKRFYSFCSKHTSDLGEYDWYLCPNHADYYITKKRYDSWEDYLNLIKEELNTREHIIKK